MGDAIHFLENEADYLKEHFGLSGAISFAKQMASGVDVADVENLAKEAFESNVTQDLLHAVEYQYPSLAQNFFPTVKHLLAGLARDVCVDETDYFYWLAGSGLSN